MMTTWKTKTTRRRTRTNSKRRFEAICFDLDETLVDSAVSWRNGFIESFTLEALPRHPSLAAIPDIYEALQPFFRAEVEAIGGSWGPHVVRDGIREFIQTYAEPDD